MKYTIKRLLSPTDEEYGLRRRFDQGGAARNEGGVAREAGRQERQGRTEETFRTGDAQATTLEQGLLLLYPLNPVKRSCLTTFLSRESASAFQVIG